MTSFYYTGRPCDTNGDFLPPDAPPPQPPAHEDINSWDPFDSRAEFDFAWFHFMKEQTSASGINTALDIWAASLLPFGADTPWKNVDELYSTIDSIQLGDTPWKTVKVRYTGPLPAGQAPKWMTETYEFCFRNTRQVLHQQLASPNFKNKMNYVPYRQFNPRKQRVYSNLMSGDWAWKQAVSARFNQFLNKCSFKLIGYRCRRPCHPWRIFCANCWRQRQNHCHSRHRTSRISPSLYVSW